MTESAQEAGPVAELVKRTYNHTPAALAAVDELASNWRVSRTDAVNHGLRIAAVMLRLAPDGHLVVIRPDGTTAEVYLV
ncbi:hypothetical protein OG792_33340 [Micromonospora sp. NBC_01699]|uniref:hypothetical protein n=1 Tax=Micromonospora sp. NBC_01699 TaxID=2975984 RepID=UPI002E292BEC|nr:hypothetical protein [Micromonospora sp. NBC_01699]